MPHSGSYDRMKERRWKLEEADANQATWDLGYHTYFRINVENNMAHVAFLGPESEEYGAAGWVRASKQHGTCAENKQAAEVEARAALRAAFAQLKIKAHSASASAAVFPFATLKEGNDELRAQYDQKNGAGAAQALFQKAKGDCFPSYLVTATAVTMKEQNVILSTLLGAPYAKALRIQFDNQRGVGSADNLFAKLGIVAPAPKPAAPVAAAPFPTMPTQPTNSQPKSARARLANCFDNQLRASRRDDK